MIKTKIDKEKDYLCKITLDGKSFDIMLEFVVLVVNLTNEIAKEFNLESVQMFNSVSELITQKLKEIGE